MNEIDNIFKNTPDWLLEKWQKITDLLAEIIGVPAALIMKAENEYMEVFISSHSLGNPYHVRDKEKWDGLYCETVVKSQHKLAVPNALKDSKWDKNPDIKLGMISYLGFPLNFPDGRPFGTLCILDNTERLFLTQNEKLLLMFVETIELDIALLQLSELKTGQLAKTLKQEMAKHNKAKENIKDLWQTFSLREQKMFELKAEVNELLRKVGKEKKYL